MVWDKFHLSWDTLMSDVLQHEFRSNSATENFEDLIPSKHSSLESFVKGPGLYKGPQQHLAMRCEVTSDTAAGPERRNPRRPNTGRVSDRTRGKGPSVEGEMCRFCAGVEMSKGIFATTPRPNTSLECETDPEIATEASSSKPSTRHT